MANTDKMRCPECDTPMNHHANKVVYGASSEDPGPFFGPVEEFHQCPACGTSASRPEALTL